ncbi:MAG: sulfite exporter TauE/SafE family protein, partial [Candidatus Competibacteraceae bacterium]|nr:sulfite exporter TauE/SafE family protein [Candidatus Competibacteraceae bacterium]
VLLGFCVAQVLPTRWRIQRRDERWLSPLAGLASGFVGGLTGLYGTIILSYLIALRLDKDTFVGTISLLYLVGIIVLSATLAGHRLLTVTELIGTVLVLLPTFAGMLLGRRLRQRISQPLFRQLLLLLLTVIGSSLIWRGWH